jgi:hypothetical protein
MHLLFLVSTNKIMMRVKTRTVKTSRLLCVIRVRSSGGDEANDMGVVAQPTVSSNLKQVCALSRVRDEYTLEQVAGVWRDVFGECEWGGYNIFIQKIDVIAFGIGRIIVEG